MFDLIVKIDAN